MSEVKVEIDCIDCNGDGWTVPYGPNGYEAQEKCETCNGSKKIMIDKVCCFCEEDLSSADSKQYEVYEGHLWCIPCYVTESDIGE